MALSIMALSTIALSIWTIGMIMTRIKTQHKAFKHNYTQHIIFCIMTLSIITLNI
jgi:hypothetical protein